MNSTPNYGYPTDIPAITAIDRDIKRVEEKTDANTQSKVDKLTDHGLISNENRDQIIVNRENIACLANKIDRTLSKCDLELHNLDPDAHRILFDQKVVDTPHS